MASTIQQFLKEHGISEVEAIIPDMAGVPRGKLMPAEKFAEEEGMRLPEAIFLQTVTGDYPDDQSAMNPSDIDIVLKADPATVRVVPWAAEPTAQVIHDCFYGDGRPVTMSPRYVLRRVLDLYEAHGWEPVIAPELEFFLVEPGADRVELLASCHQHLLALAQFLVRVRDRAPQIGRHFLPFV